MNIQKKIKNESVQNTPQFNINPSSNYKIESFEENRSILKSNSSLIEYNEKLSSFKKVNKTKVIYNQSQNNNINVNKKIEINEKTNFCTCEKSMCIKKYCECYANNERCDIRCSCINCKNIILGYNIDDLLSVTSKNKDIEISCTCTKSNCIKNYCDCYKANTLCGNKCRCLECKNNIAFVKNKEMKDKNSKKNIIEYIRVEINGNEIKIKEGKVIFFTNDEGSRKASDISNKLIFKVEDSAKSLNILTRKRLSNRKETNIKE